MAWVEGLEGDRGWGMGGFLLSDKLVDWFSGGNEMYQGHTSIGFLGPNFI